MLELRLLGEPEIFRDGMRVEPLPPRKPLALLAYLVATGRRHRRERLCSIFWELPDDPRAALRWSLTKLRHVVDEPEEKRIVADRDGVTFESGRARVDLYDVRTAVAQGLAGAPTRELEHLAGLFRGDFIEGIDLPNCQDFEAWCIAEREDVQTAQSQILSELVNRLQDDPRKALPYARALVAIAPDRVQAESLVNRLRADAGAPLNFAGEKPSVAVLPFRNMSGDPEQEYFADGITDEIITALCAWRSFPVIARNSSFVFKGAAIDVREIAGQLGARYIVEGSIQTGGQRVRVLARLIDGANGHHVWADRFDREVEDIFEVQDEIALCIASIVAPELTRAESKRATAKRPEDLGAWDCYLRGTAVINERTCGTNAIARTLFEKAIAIQPDYADAHSGVATSHIFDVIFQCVEDRVEAATLAMVAAQRAVQSDEASSAAHRVLSTAYQLLDRPDDALAEGRIAVELNPNDAVALHQYGNKSDLAGDPAGILYMEKARELNPIDVQVHTYLTFLARAHLNAGSFETAIERARQALRRRPDYEPAYYILGLALGQLGEIREARSALSKCEELHPGFVRSRENWQPYSDPMSNARLRNALHHIMPREVAPPE